MTGKKAKELIAVFSQAAQDLEVEVRTERLKGAGGIPVASGLALVEDNWVIFLEKRQPPQDQLLALVEALSRFDLSEVELEPEAAAYLNRFQASA